MPLPSQTTPPDNGLYDFVCVIVAGIFGAITAKRTILWTQGLPAAIALLLVLLS